MMLSLNDGRAELWQWDTGRTLSVDADCSQVHFSNKVFGRSIDVDVVDGAAIIPDILLQTDKDLNVWAFVGTAENGYTKISKTFTVNRRNKPSDYVFTPTDQITIQTIQSQIGDLADLTTTARDNLVAAINEAAKSGGGGAGIVIDSTLTQSGQAADAATVGNRLSAISEEIVTTAESKVSAHNTGTDTHNDIRLLISGLTDRLNTLADSDDTTLDQLSEVVAYIKSNRGLIDAITTSKVSVADIIDNLTTNVTNKPLSAAQGVALKALIDAITIPGALPNPNALTFTGAVNGIYDGSAPVSVEIPSGGGSSGGGIAEEILMEITLTEDVQDISEPITEIIKSKILSCKQIIFEAHLTKPTADDGSDRGNLTAGLYHMTWYLSYFAKTVKCLPSNSVSYIGYQDFVSTSDKLSYASPQLQCVSGQGVTPSTSATYFDWGNVAQYLSAESTLKISGTIPIGNGAIFRLIARY